VTVGCSLGQDRVEWPEACPVWGRTAKAAVDATVGGRQEACRDHSQSVRAPVEAGGGLQHARCRLERNGERRGVGRDGRTFVSIDEQLQSGLLPQSVDLELLACMSLACSLSTVLQLLIMSVLITVFCCKNSPNLIFTACRKHNLGQKQKSVSHGREVNLPV